MPHKPSLIQQVEHLGAKHGHGAQKGQPALFAGKKQPRQQHAAKGADGKAGERFVQGHRKVQKDLLAVCTKPACDAFSLSASSAWGVNTSGA